MKRVGDLVRIDSPQLEDMRRHVEKLDAPYVVLKPPQASPLINVVFAVAVLPLVRIEQGLQLGLVSL